MKSQLTEFNSDYTPDIYVSADKLGTNGIRLQELNIATGSVVLCVKVFMCSS
jgi:hypothetical protein